MHDVKNMAEWGYTSDWVENIVSPFSHFFDIISFIAAQSEEPEIGVSG